MRRRLIVDERLRGDLDEILVRPLVIRVSKFNDQAVEKFTRQMSMAQDTRQPIIPILIDSDGGDVYGLMAMIAEIKQSEIPVATIVTGRAMSAGCALFAMGKEGHRYMSPYATLMIHEVSSHCFGKATDTGADQQETERINESIFRLMAENCGQPPEYYLDLVDKAKRVDVYLDAKQAKKHKLANHIRVPTLKTVISVETTLG